LRPPRLPPQDDAPLAIGRPCGIAPGARRAAPAHAPGPGTGPRSWLGGIALVAAALARARASGPCTGAVLGAELCACARTRGGLRQERRLLGRPGCDGLQSRGAGYGDAARAT